MELRRSSTRSSNSGFTLIEVLIVVAIIGILAAVLVAEVFNARRRTVDSVTQTYARQVATWLAAADTAGADVTGVTTCTNNLLQTEGAPGTLPNGVTSCAITYDNGRWRVSAASQSGKNFSVAY